MNYNYSVKNRVAIIGAGKVGTAVGYLLRSAGYEIIALADSSASSLENSLPYTGGRPYKNPSEAAKEANIILITTPDDEISHVCTILSNEGAISQGKIVLHMSGAGGLDLLESARREGASVACIHPIQSFSDINGAIENLPCSTFGITAKHEMIEWAENFVKDLGGYPFLVSEQDKPLYHAAACMASNYLTTLIHIVENIYTSFGLKSEEAIRAFWPLVRGTLKNIERSGTVQALTGPIARGDIGTVKKHLSAFNSNLPELLRVYKELGILTIDLAVKKGTLSAERAEAIKRLLEGGSDHE
ncbi:MAG: ketol-acid reductoisomerase [Syntrophus sp. PtaB.Bin001]|nr:MAG: ketol-acid reductoisomerase [Syntrophus sp. PtaB.Bin001]